MSPLLAFFIYLLIWWVTLFTILPIGVQTHDEHGKGHDAGAPARHGLKKKLLLNTALSAVILAVVWGLVEMDIIRWHEWFEHGGGT